MLDTTIAQYRIISRIGAGGMGMVYLAGDTNQATRGTREVSTALHRRALARG